MSTALLWFRRDLRLEDNPALRHAARNAEAVVPVFIYAPDEEAPWQPGSASRWWLHQSLGSLSQQLERRGSKLIVRRGPTVATLLELCEQTGARTVLWNRLYDPAIVRRDTEVERTLQQQGIEVQSFNAALLREPWDVMTGNGEPYKVFTPFWKACLAPPEPPVPQPAPRQLGSPRRWPSGLAIAALDLMPKIDWYAGIARAWTPGEPAARQRLRRFVEAGLADYAGRRDVPGADGVSRLSPHLHFGEISPRRVWHAVRELAVGEGIEVEAEAFLRQLGWRDFAHHLLFHFPDTDRRNFRTQFSAFPWRDADRTYRAWTRGETGIPLVDAGMRELWQTGWMHNRVRMNVASFLTKNALVHWLEGARWFWDTLVDADLANNTLGWQWTAGCGADAAPYFRIFNPVLQGQRFDPQGGYVRRWVPELAALPAAYVHKPWSAPAGVLRDADIALGRDYPLPVVDLGSSRQRALSAYQAMRVAGKKR